MLVLRSGETAKGGRTWWSNPDNSGFLLQMQDDGNLCVYFARGHVVWAQGAGVPGSKLTLSDRGLLQISGRGRVFWNSMHAGPQGAYMALLGRDGNLGVFEGSDPDKPGAQVWGTAWLTTLTSSVQSVKNFNYDLAAVQTSGLNDLQLSSVKIDNTEGSEPMTITKSLSGTTTNTSSWTFGAGLKVGVETQVECGIPFLAEGKVKVGVEVSFNLSHTGTRTTQSTESLSATVTVKPAECLVLSLVVQQGNATLPYTCDATVRIREWNNMVVDVPGFSGAFSGGLSSQAQVIQRAEKNGVAVGAPQIVEAVQSPQ